MLGEDFKSCLELTDFLAGIVYIAGWGAYRNGDSWLPPQDYIISYRNTLVGSVQPNVLRRDLNKRPGYMTKEYGFAVCFPDCIRKDARNIREDVRIFASCGQTFEEITAYGALTLSNIQPAPHVFKNMTCESLQQFGLVDHLALQGINLEIGGWAFFKYANCFSYASQFIIKVNDQLKVVYPDRCRDDVRQAYNLPPGYYGFHAQMKLNETIEKKELNSVVMVYAASSEDDLCSLPFHASLK